MLLDLLDALVNAPPYERQLARLALTGLVRHRARDEELLELRRQRALARPPSPGNLAAEAEHDVAHLCVLDLLLDREVLVELPPQHLTRRLLATLARLRRRNGLARHEHARFHQVLDARAVRRGEARCRLIARERSAALVNRPPLTDELLHRLRARALAPRHPVLRGLLALARGPSLESVPADELVGLVVALGRLLQVGVVHAHLGIIDEPARPVLETIRQRVCQRDQMLLLLCTAALAAAGAARRLGLGRRLRHLAELGLAA